MRVGVNAHRQPAHHRETAADQVARELARHLLTVGTALTGAHQGDREVVAIGQRAADE
mgnify:CR=1 FL=1